MVEKVGEYSYLIKIKSHHPLMFSIFIGDEIDVGKEYNKKLLLFFLSSGVILSTIIYTLFIGKGLNDSLFADFSIYIFIYYISIIYFKDYHLAIINNTNHTEFFRMFLSMLAYFFMVRFSLKFLNIKENFPKVYKIILFFGVSTILLIPAPVINPIFGPFIFISLTILFLLLIAVASYIYIKNNYLPALYFTLGTGVFFLSILIYSLMLNGKIEFNFFTMEVILMGSTWEVLAYSLALTYKINLLHQEKEKNLREKIEQERLLIYHSRQKSLGELTGSIAHQWRSPLSDLGAILSNLRIKSTYKELPSKNEILQDLYSSDKIIRYLSDTIDTFQNFFQDTKGEKEKVSINHAIELVIDFVKEGIKNNNINLTVDINSSCYIPIHKNDFFHALINIILNSKDILIERNISNPYIKITVQNDKNHGVILIEDNGEGVKIQPIKKIFEPYFTSKKNNGNGLGLFITSKLLYIYFYLHVSFLGYFLFYLIDTEFLTVPHKDLFLM